MRSNFTEIMPYIFKEEGGYVDNPKDPGGATNMGITQGTLSGWMGRAASREEVKNLSKGTAMEIYRKQYWDKIDGDHLPPGVDYALLDFAVNSGTAHAIKMLQQVLDVPETALIDPRTMAALAEQPLAQTINALCDARAAWLKKLAAAATFGKGWQARVKRVRTRSLALAATQTDVALQPPPVPPISASASQQTSAAQQSETQPQQSAISEMFPPIHHPGIVGTVGSVASSLIAILLDDGYLETGLAVFVMIVTVSSFFYFTKWGQEHRPKDYTRKLFKKLR
ncbi:glycoside hydrolase family 108 protein [Brucella sp. BE17]|uniref:glycoside hydrolase family 108 protein n=1 Tax=Brucella sp. BE17 TaxID=3142977 RepID=UPI0031BAA2B7